MDHATGYTDHVEYSRLGDVFLGSPAGDACVYINIDTNIDTSALFVPLIAVFLFVRSTCFTAKCLRRGSGEDRDLSMQGTGGNYTKGYTVTTRIISA